MEIQGQAYLSAALVLCSGFTQTPMSCFVDALRLAADHDDESKQILFKWDYASAAQGPLISSAGLEVRPTISLSDALQFDCIVVCGGLIRDFGQVQPELVDLLRDAHAQSKLSYSRKLVMV